MFTKLATLALIVPYVSALTMNALVGATTGGTVTISWTASSTDPTSFSVQLINTAFHNTFAIANNVQTAQGLISVVLPQVPVGDGYTIEAIANNNVNTVYSQSGDFSIGAATTSSATGSSTSSTPEPTSATTSSATTSSATTSASSSSASTFSATITTIIISLASSSTSVASSSTASATPSLFKSSGTASSKLTGAAPAAALVLSVIAGAATVF